MATEATAPGFDLTTDVEETGARISCRLDRPADFCYRLFCDVEAIPRWLMVVNRATVRTRDERGRGLLVDFVGELEGTSVSYTLEYAYDDLRRRVSWRDAGGGDISALSGSAVFEPADDGCLMRYRLHTELPDSLPSWADALYRSRPAESVVVEFCEWVCRKSAG